MSEMKSVPSRDRAEASRSSIDITAIDQNPASPGLADKDDEADSTSTSAQKISTWLLTIYGVALLLGFITSIVGAAVLRSPNPRLTGAPNVFDLSCNDMGDSIEQRFSLDLTVGNFTFAQAKTIDMAWDTIIGQGGRFLHGWILYRCVLHPLLVVLLEHFAVTSDFYIALSFSQSSFQTLCKLVASIFQRGSATVFLCILMSIYALGYTLLFSVIWGTATGYVNLSQNHYPMPDGSVVGLNSPDLSLCWELDGTRLGLNQRLVELGPNFADVGGFTKELTTSGITLTETRRCFNYDRILNRTLQYMADGWRSSATSSVWDYFALTGDPNSIGNSSLNFRSIRNCG